MFHPYTPLVGGEGKGTGDKSTCTFILKWTTLTSYRLLVSDKGTHAWTLIGEGELCHAPHRVHIGACSIGTK